MSEPVHPSAPSVVEHAPENGSAIEVAPSASRSGPEAGIPESVTATMVVSADGIVAAASDEAVRWWQVGGLDAIVGRPFAELFFFESPVTDGDPTTGAWNLLEAAATVRPLTLQARVADGGFEAAVHLARDAVNATEEVYMARITRPESSRVDPVPSGTDATSVPNSRPETPPPSEAEPSSPPAASDAAAIAPVSEPESAPAEPVATFDDDAKRDDLDAGPDDDEPLPDLNLDEDEEDDFLLEEDDPVLGELGDRPAADPAVEGKPPEASLAAADDDEEDPGATVGLEDHDDGGPLSFPSRETTSDWSALDGSNVGLFELNFTIGTARYSEAWGRLLGYDPDDVAADLDTLGSLIHPEDSEALPDADARGPRAGRQPFATEVRLRAKDGSWQWVQLEGMQSFGDDGHISRLNGVMLDAQERHEVEEEMGRSEEQLRRLLGPGRFGFFELNLTDDTGFFSPEFRHVLGYAGGEPLATPDGFLRLLTSEDAEVGLDAFFNAIDDSGAGLTRRMRLVHADGRELDFDVLLSVQRNRRRAILTVTGVLAPAPAGGDFAVSARPDSAVTANVVAPTNTATEKLAEAARLALDAVAEAVVLTDETGCINHANLRALQWTGGDPAKVLARPVHEVFPLVDRANSTPASEVVRRVLEGGSALELDHRYALPEAGGTRAHVVITCRALHDVRKRVCGGIVILRKPAEMPLSPAELVASNRMETLGRLACGIAHDFNNILTTVTGAVSLAVDQRKFEALGSAQKALETARNLARQLLTFARGDTSEKKVQLINDVIKETARLTSAGSRSAVTLELGADVFPVNIDSVRIVQVFTNLILNAMQVMPDGGRIWVRTQNMRLGQVNSVALAAGEYVRVEVQDNGPGIKAEHLEHIFEPFFSMRSGGTGLGLAMVRSIITQHEGAIEVASTVGAGTTFTLYFPRASHDPVKESTKPMAMTHGTGRILVMDDDEDLCMIAKGMLEVLGYEAETAMTAEATIAAVRKYRDMGRSYSAVILDLTMAGGPGGEDVLPRLLEIDPHLVAIVSSGYVTEDQEERYAKLGFKGTLAKPYRSGDLGRALKDVLAVAK